MTGPGDVTTLLIASSHGNRDALDRLMAAVHDELRALARVRLRGDRPHHTVDTIGLVHEAYPRLVGIDRVGVEGSHALLCHGVPADAAHSRRLRASPQ